MKDFYANLDAFDSFEELTEIFHYRLAPENWYVIVCDVQGSTEAIERGEYKQVNTVGAAVIVAAQNALKGEDFPYVFGGDGATCLVSGDQLGVVKKELIALKGLCQDQYQLKMRVGVVPMRELRKLGTEVWIAKFQVFPGKNIALFQGGGLSIADDLVKKNPEKYCLERKGSASPTLEGLSCRWNPIEAERGQVVSLLVQARGEAPNQTYGEVLKLINQCTQNDLSEMCPVDYKRSSFKSMRECIQNEGRYYQSRLSFSFLKRLVEIVLAVFVFKYDIPPLFFKHREYCASMRTHSDFRKFDDMLRMVIDCSDEELKKIELVLENFYRAGKLYYGVHVSSHALMTCFVNSVGEGGHIHFVDGGDGGYAMAAKGLKGQISKDNENVA